MHSSYAKTNRPHKAPETKNSDICPVTLKLPLALPLVSVPPSLFFFDTLSSFLVGKNGSLGTSTSRFLNYLRIQFSKNSRG